MEAEPRKAEVRTMPLPVKLTEAEIALRAQELATSEGTLADCEIRLEQFVESSKGVKKGIETEIVEARMEVGRLAGIVRQRQEYREIPIREELDFELGACHTYRTDTNEIVATRGMTAEERQRPIPFDRAARDKKPS